jgi:hypothetical protein
MWLVRSAMCAEHTPARNSTCVETNMHVRDATHARNIMCAINVICVKTNMCIRDGTHVGDAIHSKTKVCHKCMCVRNVLGVEANLHTRMHAGHNQLACHRYNVCRV